ncbi:uncharacterized protein FIBRA_06459 [Fibroporia radiculosa]|uniref:Uncharacterized protein n=1 Tax=Fibroporia radiculosa TaxID=599839 RepID=J4GBJ5_9APHY|nr:uncharacterized protein FIBRA_06459 [Fibroporia radiculosa]CCM04288.1 predicted protein [Fibroporia radiculosa]
MATGARGLCCPLPAAAICILQLYKQHGSSRLSPALSSWFSLQAWYWLPRPSSHSTLRSD